MSISSQFFKYIVKKLCWHHAYIILLIYREDFTRINQYLKFCKKKVNENENENENENNNARWCKLSIIHIIICTKELWIYCSDDKKKTVVQRSSLKRCIIKILFVLDETKKKQKKQKNQKHCSNVKYSITFLIIIISWNKKCT